LPFVYWVILAALGIGMHGFVALTAWRTDATRGYLRFSAFLAGILVVLALLVDLGLAAPSGLAVRGAAPETDLLRRAGLALLALGALAFALFGGDGRSRPAGWLLGAGLAGAVLALVAAAFGWAASFADGVPLLIQLLSLSLATGGALAALVLGHWYLVTPRISVQPLLLQARLLAGVLAVQLALFATWALFGGGPGQAAFEALTGEAAFLGWLRLAVTLVFPLVLAGMAIATARTRSMESATGLLYIGVAAILAGTIGAAALYVTEGLLV
jgi:hypothetical protein